MGNKKSKKSNQQQPGPAPKQSEPSGRIPKDTTYILLIHKSTEEQERVVRHFRDALTSKASGKVRVKKIVNVSSPSCERDVKDSSWVDENESDIVVLLCLTAEAIPTLERIMRDKGYVRNDLHQKVFSVSFGASLEWPPAGIQRVAQNARDFAFNFENVDNLKPKDFEKSDTMLALLAAIKGT
ncbi:uncharacterized protein LOC114518855 [Dendronephthya gigantea]|uniref:uncharacterized protein LOC114518855 n=1 Tax=Dendronephthya gigantea TaxID=151771 RepID=UPI00106918D2|nr:uncharacterized protein LOC114518855 [Dendronephthya gigantea]